MQYYWFVVVSDRIVNVRHMPQKIASALLQRRVSSFVLKRWRKSYGVSEIPSVAYLSAALSCITARYGLWQCLGEIIADDGGWMQDVDRGDLR